MHRVPNAIEECETIDLTINCATWQLKGNAFDAHWRDGSIGHIKMEQISGKIVFEREDTSRDFVGPDRYLLRSIAFGSNYGRQICAVEGGKSDAGNLDSHVD
jgi:hypothetical protein